MSFLGGLGELAKIAKAKRTPRPPKARRLPTRKPAKAAARGGQQMPGEVLVFDETPAMCPVAQARPNGQWDTAFMVGPGFECTNIPGYEGPGTLYNYPGATEHMRWDQYCIKSGYEVKSLNPNTFCITTKKKAGAAPVKIKPVKPEATGCKKTEMLFKATDGNTYCVPATCPKNQQRNENTGACMKIEAPPKEKKKDVEQYVSDIGDVIYALLSLFNRYIRIDKDGVTRTVLIGSADDIATSYKTAGTFKSQYLSALTGIQTKMEFVKGFISDEIKSGGLYTIGTGLSLAGKGLCYDGRTIGQSDFFSGYEESPTYSRYTTILDMYLNLGFFLKNIIQLHSGLLKKYKLKGSPKKPGLYDYATQMAFGNFDSSSFPNVYKQLRETIDSYGGRSPSAWSAEYFMRTGKADPCADKPLQIAARMSGLAGLSGMEGVEIPNWVLYAGAGALLWFLLSHKKVAVYGIK